MMVPSTTQKTKDQAARTSLNTVTDLRCSGRVSSFCCTCGICHVTLVYASKP